MRIPLRGNIISMLGALMFNLFVPCILYLPRVFTLPRHDVFLPSSPRRVLNLRHCILHTYRPSILRKAQDSIADPKYDGVRVSRKKLLEMEESQSADEGEEGLENDDLEVPGHSEDDEDSEDGDEEEEEESEEEEEDEEEESEEEPPRKTKPPTNTTSNSNNPPEAELQQNVNADDLSATLAQKREEDKRKGRAVVKQLVRIILFCLFRGQTRLFLNILMHLDATCA